jgi:hypothetical protein
MKAVRVLPVVAAARSIRLRSVAEIRRFSVSRGRLLAPIVFMRVPVIADYRPDHHVRYVAVISSRTDVTTEQAALYFDIFEKAVVLLADAIGTSVSICSA